MLAALAVSAIAAQEAGWHYSPLPHEGDRATLGCDEHAGQQQFACLAVRCEDDFSTGIYVHTSRPDDLGMWDVTVDDEDVSLTAGAGPGPYGGKFAAAADWLLDRLKLGSLVYLRHTEDEGQMFHSISLSGSLYAINHALAWCAPRVPEAEPISQHPFADHDNLESKHGSPPPGTQ